MIRVIACSLKRDIIPTSLYAGRPYHVTGTGLELPRIMKQETERFIEEFVDYYYFHKHPVFGGRPSHRYNTKETYMRIDFFVDPSLDYLHLLEVNSRFVDGWGS